MSENDFEKMFGGANGEENVFGDVPFDMGSAMTAPVVPVAPVAPAPVAPVAPVAPAPVAPVAPVQPMQQMVPQVAKSVGVAADFEIGMPAGMEADMGDTGVIVADIGVKISKVPIEKYKASTQKVDRISFITKKVIAVKFHYIENVGSIICFGGKCCEIGGSPTVRYLFPIAVYSTDNEGNISGKKVELRILSAGEDLYKSIMTINKGSEMNGGIDHVDLLVTCTDDKYQKLTLTPCGAAVWRKFTPIAEFLSSRWQKDGANAYMAVARKVDEESFLKLVGMDSSDAGSVPQKYEAASNTDLSKFFES